MAKIGVQSYTFHASRDLGELCDHLAACGCGVVGVSGFHVNWLAEPAQVDEQIRFIKERGQDIVSIGPVTKPTEERVFEAARRAGTRVVAATFAPDRGFLDDMVRSAELAARHDCVVAIHNHGGHDWLGNFRMLDYIFANTPENFGLCLDTAWAMDADAGDDGKTPEGWIRRYGKRLFNMHLKDFVFAKDRARSETVIGEGNLRLKALADACREVGYAGDFLIEYEADEGGPDALRAAVTRSLEIARPLFAGTACC